MVAMYGSDKNFCLGFCHVIKRELPFSPWEQRYLEAPELLLIHPHVESHESRDPAHPQHLHVSASPRTWSATTYFSALLQTTPVLTSGTTLEVQYKQF